MIQPFQNSINSVQKAVDLTTPAKTNENNRFEFSGRKIDTVVL